MYFLGLKQYNLVQNEFGKILDLCFSSTPCFVSHIVSRPIVGEDRYHPALNIDVLDLQVSHLIENKAQTPNFYICNYDDINTYLKNIDWNVLLSCDSVNDAVNIFYNTIRSCISLLVPVKISNKTSYPSWYSRALIKIIKEKFKVYKRWKKYGNPRDYDEFSILRERQHRVQKTCFDLFTSSSEKLIKTSPKYFWKYIKNKLGSTSYPSKFTHNNIDYTKGDDICNAFNKFFESVFLKPQRANSTIPISFTHPCNDCLSKVNVNKQNLLKYLRTLDKSKGAGCDGIPPLFFASCADSLCYPISILFDRSLQEGIFPDAWKKAQIVPIHKKGSKSLIANYRPISILNTIAKLFEKVVYEDIYSIIAKGIPRTQHGFLRGRSTLSNLTLFSDFILKAMEKGGQVDVVYTDFEKAFDRVDHVILLQKLHNLGIHGDLLRWVQSYLTNRTQIVVLGGYRSDYINVPSGIPQGSHLGPLFYSAYIYDIDTVLVNSKHLLYADDKKVYISVRSVDDCKRLQHDLNNLFDYYTKNNINVSIQKCQCISFTRKNNPIVFKYNFKGIEIGRTQMVRDLGVYFDSKMLMSSHIDIIRSKAVKNLGFVIRTCSPFKDPLTIKIVYFAYVRSILEYAAPVWSPRYDIYIKRIENVQKKFINHINFKCRKADISDEYINICRAYNLLTLTERREVLDMGLLYDIIRGRLDSPELAEHILLNTPSRRLRHTPLLHVPYCHTNYVQNSVLTRLPNTYNMKFNCIDIFNGSKNIFKNKIKRHILNQHNPNNK
ncbi:unnamed protein product [Euphydryas editha]|uniref:Reverse transcriptase domain-containing protein n=1 Tax=Euphydryas editha TaxID=104508 RepID=A0AAU9UD81_EUPED|nr:unnamed protein product [Euphydryas editha]